MQPDPSQENAIRKKIQKQIEDGFKEELRPVESREMLDDVEMTSDDNELHWPALKVIVYSLVIFTAVGAMVLLSKYF